MEFYMLGLIHRAKEGPSLLKDWLSRLRPELVTVEVSNYGLTFRKTYGEQYKRMILEAAERLKLRGLEIDERAKRQLLSFFDIPYEFAVPEEYAKTNGAYLFPVDMGLFSYLYLRRVERCIRTSELESLLKEGTVMEDEREKTRARLCFERGIRTFEYTAEMAHRDRFMARRIRSLVRLLGPETAVHICGWQHLLDPLGVFDDLNPRKVFIHGGTVRLRSGRRNTTL